MANEQPATARVKNRDLEINLSVPNVDALMLQHLVSEIQSAMGKKSEAEFVQVVRKAVLNGNTMQFGHGVVVGLFIAIAMFMGVLAIYSYYLS